MTEAEKQELKDWAEHTVKDNAFLQSDCVSIALQVRSLLADQERRGEVLPACPTCHQLAAGQQHDVYPDGPGSHRCSRCGARTTRPEWWQQVPKPHVDGQD